jgi:hypothetical protein
VYRVPVAPGSQSVTHTHTHTHTNTHTDGMTLSEGSARCRQQTTITRNTRPCPGEIPTCNPSKRSVVEVLFFILQHVIPSSSLYYPNNKSLCQHYKLRSSYKFLRFSFPSPLTIISHSLSRYISYITQIIFIPTYCTLYAVYQLM